MVSIVPLNKINNTTEVINKSSIICNSHAQENAVTLMFTAFFVCHMNGLYTILLLITSNVFMTLAWYGHLKMAEFSWFKTLPLIGIIALSWGIAFFEYCLQVPANRIGFEGNGDLSR